MIDPCLCLQDLLVLNKQKDALMERVQEVYGSAKVSPKQALIDDSVGAAKPLVGLTMHCISGTMVLWH